MTPPCMPVPKQKPCFGFSGIVGEHAKQDKNAAGHVLAEEIAGIAAGNQHRLVVVV